MKAIQLPSDIKAEASLLGSMLIDPEAVLRVQPLLSPADFYVQKHGWIFEAVVDIARRRAPIDLLTVRAELEARGQLDEIGGVDYLAQLMEAVPSALNAEEYARLVAEAAVRRAVIALSSQAARLGYATDQPLEEVLTQIERGVLDLRGRAERRDRIRTADQVVNALYDQAAAWHENKQPPGIPTGFERLDQLLGGGLRPGMLHYIASRPGVGKSTMLATIALRAAKRGVPTVFFSLEMDSQEVMARLFQIEYQITLNHRLEDDEWGTFTDACGPLADLPLILDDTPDISVADLRAKALRLALERKLGLILLDYVQLARAVGQFKNRYLEVGEISRSLKNLAQELRVPIVAAAQLGRSAEGRRPTMADLRESGNLEADADAILLLHPDVAEGRENALRLPIEFILAKHRQGPTGSFRLLLDRAHLKFYDIPEERDGRPKETVR